MKAYAPGTQEGGARERGAPGGPPRSSIETCSACARGRTVTRYYGAAPGGRGAAGAGGVGSRGGGGRGPGGGGRGGGEKGGGRRASQISPCRARAILSQWPPRRR